MPLPQVVIDVCKVLNRKAPAYVDPIKLGKSYKFNVDRKTINEDAKRVRSDRGACRSVRAGETEDQAFIRRVNSVNQEMYDTSDEPYDPITKIEETDEYYEAEDLVQ